MKTPCCQSRASDDERHAVARRPPKTDRVDRYAPPGRPTTARVRARDWRRPRGEARALGWAAAFSADRGVQSRPCQSMSCAGGSPVMPSHHTSPSVGQRHVREDRVARDASSDRVRIGVRARARGHAEKAGLGVDGVQPAVFARTASRRCRRRSSRPSNRVGSASSSPGSSCRRRSGTPRRRM